MTHAQPQKKSVFNMNVDLMHGPILKSLLLFMLPILVSNLFQQLYNTVDTMIVGITLLPMARSRPAHRLYINMTTTPRSITMM